MIHPNERWKVLPCAAAFLSLLTYAVSANALPAILDSNVTTFLSGVILFQFGTGPIKGFAVTLCVGILTTVITAVYLTRIYYDYRITSRKLERISI